jgi:hypothetical protein
MAAIRRYSDAQRAAMFALYEQGCTAPEIARRCGEGTASVAPFQIPRRTVQQIVTAIARERKAKLPEKLEEIAEGQVFKTYPERVGRLLEGELDRLERKEHKGNPPASMTWSGCARGRRSSRK